MVLSVHKHDFKRGPATDRYCRCGVYAREECPNGHPRTAERRGKRWSCSECELMRSRDRRAKESVDQTEARRARGRKYHHTARDQAYEHYGLSCACCGEAEPSFLTLDHIARNGAEHRRAIGRGASLYVWLRKSGYPEGFRTLCFNCNCGRERNGGICPHEPRI